MRFPAADDNICPSCGTEFGYDDFSNSHLSLRNKWLANGAEWFSQTTRPPDYDWNGFRQVMEAGLPFDFREPRSFQESNVRVLGMGVPEMFLGAANAETLDIRPV
jgi:hypothetical protein